MSEQFIRKEREFQKRTGELQRDIECRRSMEQQAKFERDARKVYVRNELSKRMALVQSTFDDVMQERREKLRQLLKEDEVKYQKEVEARKPTKEQLVDEMRRRVAQLQAEREEHRLKVVQEKEAQLWRNNCDDLRLLESKRLEKECAKIREGQLEEKLIAAETERKRKLYYEQQWELERLKKLQREERDKAQREKLDRECFAILREQIAFLHAQRAQASSIKQQEAQLMRENMEALRLEEELRLRQKQREQTLMRHELDRFNKARIQEKQRQQRIALEQDVAFISHIAALDQQEKQELSQKRKQLRQEIIAYREYLLQRKEQEKQFEKELDKMYEAEAEKAYKRRSQAWIREQQAREKLMQEVVESRKEQIARKCIHLLFSNIFLVQEAQNARREILQETETIKKAIQDHLSSLESSSAASKQKVIEYKRQLDEQMEQIVKQRAQDKLSAQIEDQIAIKAQTDYETRLALEKNKILQRIAQL